VSVDSLGSEGNLASAYPSISGDGRWVLFESWANNLVANDTNGTLDVFGFDQLTSTTVRLSQATAGAQGNGASRMPAASAAGDVVAFWSFASSLVSGDTNLSPDVFVDASLAAAPMSFCTAGTTSNGCVPQISANAQPQASGAGSCQILVQSVEGQRSGIVFYGIDNSGYAAPAWGAGTSYLCVKPPTQRTAVQSSGGSFNACDGSLQLDWNAFQLAHPSALGAPWSVGASAYVQAWFRDPPAPKSTNLSDALHLQYLP
jgi:Tol biopolymer transport system component